MQRPLIKPPQFQEGQVWSLLVSRRCALLKRFRQTDSRLNLVIPPVALAYELFSRAKTHALCSRERGHRNKWPARTVVDHSPGPAALAPLVGLRRGCKLVAIRLC